MAFFVPPPFRHRDRLILRRLAVFSPSRTIPLLRTVVPLRGAKGTFEFGVCRRRRRSLSLEMCCVECRGESESLVLHS